MPFSRTDAAGYQICTLLADGWTLRQIARELNCAIGTISRWSAEDPIFGEQYARAMAIRAERMASEIEEIADDGTNDWVDREVAAGVVLRVPDHEHIQRSRLRVESRKWLMSKMLPKKYGDRVDSEITVRRAPSEMTDEELAAIAAKGVPALSPPVEEE